MSADRNQPRPAGTQTSPRDSHPVRSSDVEVFDPLRLHDPSRQWSAAAAMERWRGDQLRWVRAGDALAQTCGRATGRGIVWTASASRLPRLAPRRQTGTGRRAIARASVTARASELAPLTAFGTRADPQPSAARKGVSR
jgi:hypothetical protein